MKLYFEILKLLFRKFILMKNAGVVIKQFCEKMGIVYIKLAQMLATQNIGNIFTEKDRLELSSICDDCKKVEFDKIRDIIENEYGKSINETFKSLEETPIGSASISQVYKAVLENGDVVAVKVKRSDITDSIPSDIKRIRKLMHMFGWAVGFKNTIGGNKALDLYLKWIREEVDFIHERQNIRTYNEYADSVNGKIPNLKYIRKLKLYEELCTENILVMEFINYKTVNKLELNEKNKQLICEAFNSYLQLGFYALFNRHKGIKVVFHGDPHGGNVYIDDDGNIGFLDMGLLVELSKEDMDLIEEFFIAAYTSDNIKLSNMILQYGEFDSNTKDKIINDISKYCKKVKDLNITSYFVEMIGVCTQYKINPPNYLFSMAKAFVRLNGICYFSDNLVEATKLLKEQVIEFYIRRSFNDTCNLAVSSLTAIPKLLIGIGKYGIISGIAKQFDILENIQKDFNDTINNQKEALKLFKMMYSNDS